MCKILITIIIIVEFLTFNNNHSRGIAKAIKSNFTKLVKSTDSIYLSGKTITRFEYGYEDLQHKIAGKDSQLLKVILDSGSLEILTPEKVQKMLKPYQIRILGDSEFERVKVPNPLFSEKELAVVQKVNHLNDSLVSYPEAKDSFGYRDLFGKEQMLMGDRNFKSYLEKKERAVKKLLMFPPIVVYKNYVLITIVSFNSFTNSNYSVRILSI
jgi:hypothetical protein